MLISLAATVMALSIGMAKPMPLGAGSHRHVDADHLAVDVQQRSAGIAGIDAGVGLDQIVVTLRIAHLHRCGAMALTMPRVTVCS